MFLRNLHKWESPNTDGTQGRERERSFRRRSERTQARRTTVCVILFIYFIIIFFYKITGNWYSLKQNKWPRLKQTNKKNLWLRFKWVLYPQEKCGNRRMTTFGNRRMTTFLLDKRTWTRFAATRWAQSELFFCLLLKSYALGQLTA